MPTTVFRDPDQLSSAIDCIHDRWFDRDKIAFDRDKSVLAIPFFERSSPIREFWSLRRAPTQTTGVLRIHNVVTYTIKDPKKVGIYDFNELIYDPERKRLSITTGVPIEIEVTVSSFELDIEEPRTEAPSGGVAQ